MSRDQVRPIAEVLRSGDISKLRREAAERRELKSRVRSELPPADADHVVGAHFDDRGYLVISADSAAWAAKLRYSATELLGKPVRIRVSPEPAPD